MKFSTSYKLYNQQPAPSASLVSRIITDITHTSASVEKLNILLGALSRPTGLVEVAGLPEMLNAVIGNCRTTVQEYNIIGYFTSQRETTEPEMVLALKIAQLLSDEDVRAATGSIKSCLSYNGEATIQENAIVALAPVFAPEELVQLVNPGGSHGLTAALIVGLRESHNKSPSEVHQIFSSSYNLNSRQYSFINDMIIAMDTTESSRPDYRFSKELEIPLPAVIEEIEMLSGLRLRTDVTSSGASITISNTLLNGMLEMLK